MVSHSSATALNQQIYDEMQRQTGWRITLVVHDWGGAIGMGLAARCPERIARLVILNTAAFRSARIPWRIAACRWPVLGELALLGGNVFARAALRMAVEKPVSESARRVVHWTA